MPTSEAVVLPANVRPSQYRIKLQPDLTQFTFQGEETIRIQVMEPTSEILLNAVELQVQSATLSRDGARTATARISYDKSRETLNLAFGETIPAGARTPPRLTRTQSRPVARAIDLPREVFPTPGGPTRQRIGPFIRSTRV